MITRVYGYEDDPSYQRLAKDGIVKIFEEDIWGYWVALAHPVREFFICVGETRGTQEEALAILVHQYQFNLWSECLDIEARDDSTHR